MVSAALVHQNHPFTVEIPTNYRRTIPVSHRIKPSHTVVSATWYIKNTPVPARYDQLTDIVILELWSDDISRPLTCIHSRSERWISGQSGNPYATNSPSWSAGMHIIRGGGLGWAETWSWAPLFGVLVAVGRARPARTALLPTLSGAHAART
jgi:hypothetical protein